MGPQSVVRATEGVAIAAGLKRASGMRLRYPGNRIYLRSKFLLGTVSEGEVAHTLDTVFWVSAQVIMNV